MSTIWSGGTETACRFLINNNGHAAITVLAELAEALVIEPAELNVRIDQHLRTLLSTLPDNAVPLVIYPGNGANQLHGMLPALQEVTSIDVSAKRYWHPGQRPVCEVRSFSIPEQVTHCLIVDDVISSGGTMCAVSAYLPPQVEVWAVAQVSQRLGKQCKKTLRTFARVIVGAELHGEAVAYVPINSVSTLCVDRQLAESYASRNVVSHKQAAFLACL